MNQSYLFTNDWFEANKPTWRALLGQLMPRRILEIGSYEGRSTCFMIELLAESHPLEIVCIDTWGGGVEHQTHLMGEVESRFVHNIELAKSKARHPVNVYQHKKTSIAGLAELLSVNQTESFDLIYVDGSHQAPDVLCDAVLGFQLLRIGGLIVFDDYLWSLEQQGQQDLLNMPKMAIDAFTNIFQRKLRLVMDAPLRQVYAIKTAF